tara:strand:- start:473 stop:583 length:111 start_codon:yes stop_codon:yes gene_type:complete
MNYKIIIALLLIEISLHILEIIIDVSAYIDLTNLLS